MKVFSICMGVVLLIGLIVSIYLDRAEHVLVQKIPVPEAYPDLGTVPTPWDCSNMITVRDLRPWRHIYCQENGFLFVDGQEAFRPDGRRWKMGDR